MAAPTQFAINRSDLPLIENAPTHDESPDVFVRLSQDLVVALPGGSVSRARLPGRRPTSEYGVLLHQGRSLGPAMKPSRDIPTSSGTLLTVHLSGPFPLLLDDPEGHVGHVWISYQLDPLQFDMFGPEVIEQPDAVPQQHGGQVYVYFVQYPRLETLLDEASSANRDVLLASGSPGLIDRALYTVGDEGERRPLVVPSIGDGVGQDEDRDVLAYGMSA